MWNGWKIEPCLKCRRFLRSCWRMGVGQRSIANRQQVTDYGRPRVGGIRDSRERITRTILVRQIKSGGPSYLITERTTNSIARSLGARRMRVVRAGAGSFGGSLSARLRATNGPPLRSISRKVTHFGAARGGFRLRAAAVAAAGMRLAELTRSVGASGKREGS